MKCFHFPGNGDGGDIVPKRVPWARSLSVASTWSDPRKSGLDPDPDLKDAESSNEAKSLPVSLRPFAFSELKAATKGFNRGLLIGEGGFGCVYKGVINLENGESLDVAVKQLNRNGSQARFDFYSTFFLICVCWICCLV